VRYDNNRIRQKLPKWILESLKDPVGKKSFGPILKMLADFYKGFANKKL
jgi:hypothetical protein